MFACIRDRSFNKYYTSFRASVCDDPLVIKVEIIRVLKTGKVAGNVMTPNVSIRMFKKRAG
jgi:hypothetical protein